MTRKVVLLCSLLAVSTTLVFAKAEVAGGIYGSVGFEYAVGAGLQLGYGSNPSSLFWDILVDAGLGLNLTKGPGFDYFAGILGECYFLKFTGLGVGGGYSDGAPYVRGELPFLLGKSVKFAGSYDYRFDKGHRINVSIYGRGAAAATVLDFVGQIFSGVGGN